MLIPIAVWWKSNVKIYGVEAEADKNVYQKVHDTADGVGAQVDVAGDHQLWSPAAH